MNRPSIDELEMLNPGELGVILRNEAKNRHSDIKYLQDIIAVGCPIDDGDEYGNTALHLAAKFGDLEVVEFLISKGADVNARNSTNATPLSYAANCCEPDMIKFLISRGGDVNAIDEYGWSALWLAIEGGNLEVVKYLTSIGIEFITNDTVPEVENYLDLKNGWNRDVIRYLISMENYE